MAIGREVLNSFDIAWPGNVHWILRSCDYKVSVGQSPGGLYQQPLYHGLSIRAISAHITQAPLWFGRHRRVLVGVHTAVQSTGTGASISLFDDAQYGPASE